MQMKEGAIRGGKREREVGILLQYARAMGELEGTWW